MTINGWRPQTKWVIICVVALVLAAACLVISVIAWYAERHHL